MKKRLTRIFGDQLAGEARKSLPGRIPLNIVLKSGDTLFGDLVAQSETAIQIRDYRFHQHSIAIKAIDVVIFDHPSAW